jgi:C4-dicarboxylate-specific signal transduction histidine kinase
MTAQTTTPGTRRAPFGMSAFRDWRMRNKLILAFWTLTLLYAIVVGFVGLPQIRNALLATGTNSLVTSANSTASSLDQYLNDKVEDIKAASQLPEFSAFLEFPLLPNTKTSGLQALKALSARSDYESVALVDITGKAILSSSEADIGTDLSFRDYVIEALKGNTYASEPTVSVVTNRPAIYFSAPIKDASGKIIGVIRSRLGLSGVWGLVEKDKDGQGLGTYGMLLDPNGIRIANSLSLGRRDEMEGSMLLYTAIAPLSPNTEKQLVDEKRFGKSTSTNVQVVAMPQVANALVTPGIKSFETASDVNPELHQAAVAALATKPWRYVLMTPVSVFTKSADDVRNVFTIVLLTVGFLSLIVAYFMARGVTEPIAQLTRAADAISLGELDTKIDVDRKDEVGELAEAVARMQASLQAAIERLRARRVSQ